MTATSGESLKQEITTAFRKVGLSKIDANALSQCVAFASASQLTPTQVAECWDAVSISHGFNSLNDHSWKTLRPALLKITDDNVVPPPMTSSGNTTVMIKRKAGSPEQSSSQRPGTVVTPAAKASVATALLATDGSGGRRISLSPRPPVTGLESARKKVKYEERQGAGTVVATYQPELAGASAPAADQPRCVIAWRDDSHVGTHNVTQPYRHLFTTLPQKAQALETHLNRMSQLFQEMYAFGESDLAPLEAVGLPRQEVVCCLGRICSSAHEGRMNATTVLLEGSKGTCGGARVEVDLRHLKSDYSLFPGQIVAIEGLNTTGRSLVAQRLCDGAPHPANTTPAADLFRHHYQVQNGSPLHIVTAAGPFTTADNLEYQPFLDLISNLVQSPQQPDVVVLTGPFVDLRQPQVATGNTVFEGSVVPFEVLFCHKVAQVLEEYYEGAEHATQFILQPSVDDATAEWVFPQPPLQDRLAKREGSTLPGGEDFELGTLGLQYVETVNRDNTSGTAFRRVHCIPNPCTLRINEVVVGITSTDVLFHTSVNETNGNLPAGSRLARISQHLLQQRSYYPLFPGSINLDWQQTWAMPCRPDLLICPSKLSPFAKPVLESTLVVNPGPLTRDTAGGTYAVMQIHPLPRDVLEAADPKVELPHNVAQRTRVEVKRV